MVKAFKLEKVTKAYWRADAKNKQLNRVYGSAFWKKSEMDEHYEMLEEAKQVQMNCPVHMGGAGSINLIYQLTEYIQATKAIETGVAYGWSSLAFLLPLKKRNGRLISTDMPYSSETAPYAGCVVPTHLRSGWRIIKKPDQEALPEAIAEFGNIDICHYDSDKSEDGRRWAYPLLWNALRPGGFFVSDDIGDNMGFQKFCSSIGVAPLVVEINATRGLKYVGIVKKPLDFSEIV